MRQLYVYFKKISITYGDGLVICLPGSLLYRILLLSGAAGRLGKYPHFIRTHVFNDVVTDSDSKCFHIIRKMDYFNDFFALRNICRINIRSNGDHYFIVQREDVIATFT